MFVGRLTSPVGNAVIGKNAVETGMRVEKRREAGKRYKEKNICTADKINRGKEIITKTTLTTFIFGDTPCSVRTCISRSF